MGTGSRSPKDGHEVLLGKYELGRVLGRGTFAKVYHARALSDGTNVAIKVLDKPEAVCSGMAPRILREVSAMSRLSHPNIVRLHEVMATKSKIYLVMEHARGGELFARISRRGRLPEPMARRYFQQLVSALRFCHARGVSHRDVKPQNLLLDRDGNLKISDFGLSALPEHVKDGLLHTACGTPAYTAPEVIRRKGYDGAKADAWSCGVILFVLLAGFLPFDDANLPLMYRKIQKRDYEFPPWFPPSAKRVVFRLLDPNPETRLTIEGVMELPWFKRSLSVDSQLSLMENEEDTTTKKMMIRTISMNAFDIISLSKGLDLSGMFEGGRVREQRFTTKETVEKVSERIREVGMKLGYEFENRKGGIVGVGKDGSVLKVEVSEVAPPLLLVELKEEGSTVHVSDHGDVDNGNGERVKWDKMRRELADIVFAWHNLDDDDDT
ncbi:CBL-interacting serine/threonine-protein kinase 4-like [Dioscorea cayenensis subsp. rotundata]|uniref:non-specific serine/threonine protein kinase n=1 Tax=Dioscorea cayennensis subsp. rotundata TaxID=55577 RepID=A0AB40BWE1_DIOCR|nr:CBL-interacting serine/threonine-protein kinase 4-like [Dioscorea cayenensis subsp. rotundata]